MALIAIVTVVVISAWQVSGGGGAKPPDERRRADGQLAHADDRRPPDARRLAAHRGAQRRLLRRGCTATVQAGRMLFQGTVTKGAKDMPFAGKYFWLTVSSPSDLAIVVDGVRIRLPGSKPAALTITPSGVRSD